MGKTALGIQLAQAFNGEIISGDSQQVYRKLNIGTAKATAEEQTAAKHHLIDVREVTETYSAFDFVVEAKEAIDQITCRGKVPIIVGGTGLYLQSLLEGYHLGGQVDQKAVLAYRQELNAFSDEILFGKIAELGLTIPELNRRRAMRALELDKFSDKLENQMPDYDALLICLTDERERLYDRINARVDKMVEAGLLDEAKWLYETFPDAQAARAIGYKELFPYFAGETDLPSALNLLKQNSRRFAKRQLTWFRNRMDMMFYDVSDSHFPNNVREKVAEFLDEK